MRRTRDPAAWHRAAQEKTPKTWTEILDLEGPNALSLLFCEREGGYAIELGGQDGWTNSETRILKEVVGMRRIIIEGNPEWRPKRMHLSPHDVGIAAAICDSPGTLHWLWHRLISCRGIAEFMSATRLRQWYRALWQRAVDPVSGTLDWSRVNWNVVRQTTVVCMPLSAVLERIGVDHYAFFVLDVEGAELSVLKTIDWRRTRFDVLVIETWTQSDGPERTAAVVEAVQRYSSHAYKVLFKRYGRNVWLVRSDFVGHSCGPGLAGLGHSAMPARAWRPLDDDHDASA
mmetsp:Transcript_25358/g.65516  ORF Transcript_25358/g.65516 Transcript_25358/m.65516 type:complete len:287 (+) Transcript_25358:200-1060(+)